MIYTKHLDFMLPANESEISYDIHIPFVVKKMVLKCVSLFHPQGGGAHNFFIIKTDLIGNNTIFSAPELTFVSYTNTPYEMGMVPINGRFSLKFYTVDGGEYTHSTDLKFGFTMLFYSS